MPRALLQSLRIHPVDVTDDAVEVFFQTKDVAGLIHETRLPGGFWQMSFVIPTTDGEYWTWRNRRRLFRGVLDQALSKVFEGRLEIVEMLEPGRTKLTFKGYWSNFMDAFVTGATSGSPDYDKSYNAAADVIIKDMINNGFGGNVTRQVSTDFTNIEAPGVTIDVDYLDSESLWAAITDRTKGIIQWPDSNDQKVDFAVWEDQLVFLTVRDSTNVDWFTSIKGARRGLDGFNPRVNERNVANALYVVHSGSTLGDAAVDVASQGETISKEFVVPDIGTSTTTPANARRDQELEARKDAQQETEGFAVTRVWNVDGIEQPICNIRAGDLLRVDDFVPNSFASGVGPDAQRLFLLTKTTCDHDRGMVSVELDRDGPGLAALLRRNNVK